MSVNGPGAGGPAVSPPAPENKKEAVEEGKENKEPKGFVLGKDNVRSAADNDNKPKRRSLADRAGGMSVSTSGGTSIKPQDVGNDSAQGVENRPSDDGEV